MNASQPMPLLHDLSHLHKVAFVSDIHLEAEMPLTARRFQRFLRYEAHEYQAIFILGDLFAYWVGDEVLKGDSPNSLLYNSICHDLAQLPRVFFIAGNRDFLVGQSFFRQTKMIALPDPCYVKIGPQFFGLSHGDQWCFLDRQYLRFRQVARLNWVKSLFMDLPYSWRDRLAQRLRAKSREWTLKTKHTPNLLADPKYDVPLKSFDEWLLSQWGSVKLPNELQYIIHGHTHLSQVHHQVGQVQRWVLPDWDFEGEDTRGRVLSYQAGRLEWQSLIEAKVD